MFLLVVALFFGIPPLWLLLAPTKTSSQLLNAQPLSFGSLANYARAWSHLQSYESGIINGWIGNSIQYTLASVAIAVALSVPAGYALATYRFASRKALLLITLVAMILPSTTLVIPLYLEMNTLGLVGGALSVILPLGFYPFGVYLAYIYYTTSLPSSLLEAARLDGCSEIGIFWRIAAPIGRPIMALIAFFGFVKIWSDFYLPYIMLGPSEHAYTLPLGLESLLGTTNAVNGLGGNFSGYNIHQPEAALAALISIAPILVAFLFAQRFVVAGQTGGAEKA